ncbi:MAG: GDP-mannose 4,6-dehydratase [Maribacter sp.]
MEQRSKGRMLITGIDGFTGAHLETALIKSGYDVFGTTYSTSRQSNHFQCNILDKVQIKEVLNAIRPIYIIHLAAISFVASENINVIYETNIIGTLNLLEGLDELGLEVKKILLASSAAVYGNIGNELSEEMTPKPINHYGNSKLAMENMAANYFGKYEIILLRPFNYTGVGQGRDFLIPKIVDHFKREDEFIELGNLYTFREYNSVKTFVDIYIRLLESSFCSGAINICSGSTYSIEQILQIMSELADYSIKVKVNQKFIRKNEIIELKGSTKKLIEILGSSIHYIDLKHTLRSMYLG